jgi:hypothetical protein
MIGKRGHNLGKKYRMEERAQDVKKDVKKKQEIHE